MAKRPPKTPEEILAEWMEVDLTAEAAAGRLEPAFGVEDRLAQMCDLLAGGRVPVLAGAPGVGKTAAVHELARRVAAGSGGGGGGPPELAGRRIVQLSIQMRIGSLPSPHQQLGQHMQQLVMALQALGDTVAPFFRDLHLAEAFNLEQALQLLSYRFPGPMLAEGDRAALDQMFEYAPALLARFVPLPVEEPSPDATRTLVGSWADDRRQRGKGDFDPVALDAAVILSSRFMTRTRMPRQVIELLRVLEGLAPAGHTITEADVIDRFCRTHRVPRVLIDPKIPLDLSELESEFRAQLLGQTEAVAALVSLVGMVKAGLSDIRRPFGALMFVGPTGVGKTHAAQLLAEYLFGSRDRMIRLNMADYQSEQAAQTLFGDPHGHNASMQRGELTARVLGQPFAVLLLDEFEKADAKVHDRFMQLLDEGSFINGVGESISCRSMIIIATSNAGAEVYRSQVFGFGGSRDLRSLDTEVDHRLHTQFRFELLNRFDRIVHFHPLSRADIRTIARRELELLRQRSGVRQRGLEIEIDESVLDWLTVHGYDPDYGARFLRRTIERHVAAALADAIVREAPGTFSAVRIAAGPHGVTARAVADPAPVRRSAAVELPTADGAKVARLGPAEIRAEAARIAAEAAPLLAALETRIAERSGLLEQMNDAGFWGDEAARSQALDRFRQLDVQVRTEQRFASPLQRLAELMEAGADPVEQLAPRLATAAEALRQWRWRLAEEGEAAVWVVISPADLLHPDTGWMHDLADMELAWCRRMHLAAQVVAVELHDGDVLRVFLEVEGPGAATFLEMEQGTHRLRRPRARDLRARIDILPRSSPPAGDGAAVRPAARRASRFGLEADRQIRVAFADRGLKLTLHGASGPTLAHLAADLAANWRPPQSADDTARLYADEGAGARDPRTGASIARTRDALRGRLDVFLEAWMAQSGASGAEQPAASGLTRGVTPD